MRKHVLRKLSALLALVLLLGAMPFAAAAGECSHSSTTKYYTANEDGAHLKTVVCNDNDCGETLINEDEFCIDMDDDRECDKCEAIMPDYPLCDHEDNTGSFKATGFGTHLICLVCDVCAAELIEYEEDCADKDQDALCDSCGAEMVAPSDAVMSCEQSGSTVSGSSAELVFELDGVDTDDIEWTFTASGSAAPELDSDTDTGRTGVASIRTGNGNGVAVVTATAAWDGGQARGSAAVSFCDRQSYTVQVKKDTKNFSFTKTKVLESITNVAATKVENYSLYKLLTDGCGTYVKLYEDSKLNERVATISYRTTDKEKQYDPGAYNTYGIASLGRLNFNIVGEGTYELKYEILEKVGSYMLPTTRGTIDIVTGTPKDLDVDLLYRTTAGTPISFELIDFVSYWEENRSSKTEDLRFVQFDIDEKAIGVLYLDETLRGTVSEDYMFFAKLQNEETVRAGYYELDGITYRPDPREEAYTEEIGFIAYGRRNGTVRGTITVTVGEKMSFSDVTSKDWFYEEVSYVFSEGIMNGVSDTEFDPSGTLTRGMVVTMLHRAAGEPKADTKADFSDVADDAWYADAVAWAAANGIVNGMGDGTFAPETDITREQLAAILYRYAGHALLDTNTGDASVDGFADHRNISDYATDAMTWAVYHQIMNGADGYLTPAANATRAQAAVAFCRLLK